jgi:RND family efflux transporter MFP subunit
VLAEGQTATFTLVDGSAVEGTLRRLPASIDSRTRTGEALFALPQGTRVRAGMYLRGHANLPPREVIAVPQSSVLYDSGQAYVLVIDDTNHVHRVDVRLGGRDGDWVEVVMGLDPNQRIVGSGAAFLQDGEEVRVLQDRAPTAPEPDAAVVGPNEDIRGRKG